MKEVHRIENNVEKAIHEGKIDEAIQLYEKILLINETNPEDMLRLKYINALILKEMQLYNQALITIEEVINNIDTFTTNIDKFKVKILYALLLILTGNVMKAKNEANNVQSLISKMKEIDLINGEVYLASFANIRGMIYHHNGELDDAHREYNKALTIFRRQILRKEEGEVLYNIASILRVQNKFKLCITYLENAFSAFEAIKYYKGQEFVLQTLEDVARQIGDDEAEFRYKQKLSEIRTLIELNECKVQFARSKANFTQELAQLNQERIELEKRIWQLEFQLNSTSSGHGLSIELEKSAIKELETLKFEYNELMKKYKDSNNKIENLKLENDMLNDQINQLKNISGYINEEELKKLEKENEELQNQINLFTRQLDDAIKNNDNLRSSNDELAKRIIDLEVKVSQLNEKNKLLEGLIEDKSSDDTINRLENEIQDKNNQLNQYKEEVKNLKINNEKLSMELEKLKGEYEDKINNLRDEYQKKVDTLTEINKKMEVAITTSGDENLEDLQKEIETLKQQDSEKTKQIENLKYELETIKSEKSKIEEDLKSEIATYKSKIDELGNQKDEEYKSEIKSRDEQINNLKEQIKELRLKSLEISNEHDDTILKLKSKISQLEEDVKEYKVEKNRIQQLELDKNAIQSKLDEKTLKLKEYEAQIAKINEKDTEINDLKSKLSKLENELKTKTEEINSLKKDSSTVSSISDELVKVKQDLKKKEKTLEKLQTENDKLLNEVRDKDNLADELSRVEEKLDERDNKIKQLEMEIEKLIQKPSTIEDQYIKQIEEKDKLIQELKSQNEQLKTTTESLEAINKLKAELHEKDELIQKLKAEASQQKSITDTVEAVNELKKELKEKDNKIRELEAQIKELKVGKISVEERKPVESKPIVKSEPERHIGRVKHKSIQPTKEVLSEILEASKLAESIYNMLKSENVIQLRFLAMRIGTSPAKCMEELRKLEKGGFVTIKMKYAEDANPTIHLN